MDLIQMLHDWTSRKLEDRKLEKFGGIQQCPWCRQNAQEGDTWSFTLYEKDPMLDLLTCGVCGGTSLWRFEVGMIFHSSLNPPKPLYE